MSVSKKEYILFFMDVNVETEESLPSELRVPPRQKRARQTVRHILDTAAVLLDEVGVDDFNTNLLAERAEVRVSTVYRYFSNKTGVLVALGERVVAEWDAWAELELAKLDGRKDWRPIVESATWAFFERVRDQPGNAAIRRAMRAVPELLVLDQQDNARLSEAYARALRRVAPCLARGRARSVARCLIESMGALVDLALEETARRSDAVIEELVAMQRAYLESVLG